MNIADITKEAGRDRRGKRLGRGRGSGRGKTCGRGHKGAGARAGAKGFNLLEGGQMPIFRRLPKRGFNNALFKARFSLVNVGALEARFEAGAHVTTQALMECGLIRNGKQPVKVLGHGGLGKRLTVDAAKFSESARQKIEGAGGKVNVI